MLSPILILSNSVYGSYLDHFQWMRIKSLDPLWEKVAAPTVKWWGGVKENPEARRRIEAETGKNIEQHVEEAKELAKKNSEEQRKANVKHELEGSDELIKEQESSNYSYLDGTLSYPEKLFESDDLPFIRYHPFNYGPRGIDSGMVGSKPPATRMNQIYLPMISSLTQNTNPNWSQEADFMSRFENSIDKSAGYGSKENLQRIGMNIAGQAGKAAAAFGAGAVKMLGGDDIVKAGLRRAGRAYNPFHERFFDGVSFRVYSFEHKFMSNSLQESVEIKNIIKRFQYYSLPDISGTRLTMTYPSIWRIGFFNPDCSRNLYLPILEDCVVTLVGVVFGGGGSWSSLGGGEPTEITLSLQVTEISVPSKRRMMKEEKQYNFGGGRSADNTRETLDFVNRQPNEVS